MHLCSFISGKQHYVNFFSEYYANSSYNRNILWQIFLKQRPAWRYKKLDKLYIYLYVHACIIWSFLHI